jgi:predicted nucleic acid-binding protein
MDTSVVVDLGDTTVSDQLPDDCSISSITVAELSIGAQTARDPVERSRRQTLLQQVESLFEPLPFDAATARSYGMCAAALLAIGRSHRNRTIDLMIAATAYTNGLPLYTRDKEDFEGLESLLKIVVI